MKNATRENRTLIGFKMYRYAIVNRKILPFDARSRLLSLGRPIEEEEYICRCRLNKTYDE